MNRAKERGSSRVFSLTTAPGRKDDPSARRVSVSTVFAVLILSLLLLLSLVTALLVWREYHATLSQGDERAHNAAQTAAEYARWLIEANMSALSRLDDALGEGTDWWNLPPVDNVNRYSELVPEGTSISVTDAAGITVLTSEPENPRPDLSDRDYFMALAEGQETYISRLVTGRMTGQKVFVVARRIEREGNFAGAALAEVPVQILAPFWISLGLGPSSSVGLINDEGWQVARHPVPEETLHFTDHVLFTEHLPRAPSGHYRSPASPVDAVGRIVGYHRVPGLPLVAVVGISQDTVLGGFRRNILISLVFGIPLLLLLGAVSVWGLGWLRREERTRIELAEALERNRMLLREIHHRVKNNLQVVTSLINMQPGSAEAKSEMSRRIAAMAVTYEHIYRGDQFDPVELSRHLPAVIDSLKESYGTAVAMSYDLEALRVPSDHALPLTLIASEVVANAFKHGFPEGGEGHVAVSLRRQDSGRACLAIADDGKGMDPSRQDGGLGMRLLRAYARQIGGDYSFEPAGDRGTRFVLDFPVPFEEPSAVSTGDADPDDARSGVAPDAAVRTAER
jgi:two-component system, sensor histidine kinase PdtaS